MKPESVIVDLAAEVGGNCERPSLASSFYMDSVALDRERVRQLKVPVSWQRYWDSLPPGRRFGKRGSGGILIPLQLHSVNVIGELLYIPGLRV
jgi:hypothetical protein